MGITRRLLVGALVASLVAAAVPMSALANITTNGSFELGTAPGSYLPLSAGATDVTGWQISAGSIDYIGSLWTASDGSRSIDMSGLGAGVIQQDLATVAGTQYLVSFDLAGNPGAGPTEKTLQVSATGAGSQQFTFDTTGKSAGDMGWLTQQWSFVATGATTTLAFTSLDQTNAGPALDNVCVEAAAPSGPVVPAPGALLLGSMGVGLVGWLRRRKAM